MKTKWGHLVRILLGYAFKRVIDGGVKNGKLGQDVFRIVEDVFKCSKTSKKLVLDYNFIHRFFNEEPRRRGIDFIT